MKYLTEYLHFDFVNRDIGDYGSESETDMSYMQWLRYMGLQDEEYLDERKRGFSEKS